MKERNVQQFIDEGKQAALSLFREQYGDRLLMAALYGSAVSGRFTAGVSDINMLAVIDDEGAGELMKVSKAGKKVFRKYRVTPLVLTKSELFASADVFPIEYLEIRETMELLTGTPFMDELEIDTRHIRHQVESMVRGSLNSLRQILLLFGSDAKALESQCSQWAGRQVPLLRAVLRLSDSYEKITETERLIDALEAFLEFPCRALREIPLLRDRRSLERPRAELVADLIDVYTKIAEVIDAHA